MGYMWTISRTVSFVAGLTYVPADGCAFTPTTPGKDFLQTSVYGEYGREWLIEDSDLTPIMYLGNSQLFSPIIIYMIRWPVGFECSRKILGLN